MTKHNKIFTAIVIATAMLMLNSCKKETTITKKVFNAAETQKIAEELFSMATPGGGSGASFKKSDFECVTVTEDSVSNIMTFDYGTGCTGTDGVVRSGVITVSYNNRDIQQTGTLMTFNFSNFFINSDEVTGYLLLENTGVNGNGNPVVEYTVNCQDLSPVNGPTDLDGVEYFEWVQGGNTPAYDDDVFSITGYEQAVAQSGGQYSLNITQPLVCNTMPGCNEYVVRGVTHTQSTGNADRYLDYGNGECDNLAVETVNGNSQTIVLE